MRTYLSLTRNEELDVTAFSGSLSCLSL